MNKNDFCQELANRFDYGTKSALLTDIGDFLKNKRPETLDKFLPVLLKNTTYTPKLADVVKVWESWGMGDKKEFKAVWLRCDGCGTEFELDARHRCRDKPIGSPSEVQTCIAGNEIPAYVLKAKPELTTASDIVKAEAAFDDFIDFLGKVIIEKSRRVN